MRRIALCFFLSLSSLVANADNWLCISDKSQGFNKNDQGVWSGTRFINGRKYLIKPVDGVSYGKAKYQVNDFGNELPGYLCKKEFGAEFPDLLVCGGYAVAGDTFKFNRKSGNYLATTTLGYVTTLEGKQAYDTPYIEIGKCSKL